jgi:hypothetical protein
MLRKKHSSMHWSKSILVGTLALSFLLPSGIPQTKAESLSSRSSGQDYVLRDRMYANSSRRMRSRPRPPALHPITGSGLPVRPPAADPITTPIIKPPVSRPSLPVQPPVSKLPANQPSQPITSLPNNLIVVPGQAPTNASQLVNPAGNSYYSHAKQQPAQQFNHSFAQNLQTGQGELTYQTANSTIHFASDNQQFAVNTDVKQQSSNSMRIASDGTLKFGNSASNFAVASTNSAYNREDIIEDIQNGKYTGEAKGGSKSIDDQAFRQIVEAFKEGSLKTSWEEISNDLDAKGYDVQGQINDVFEVELDDGRLANVKVTGSWRELFDKIKEETKQEQIAQAEEKALKALEKAEKERIKAEKKKKHLCYLVY